MGIARYLSRSDFDLVVCSLRPAEFEEAKLVLKDLGVECFVAPFRPRAKTAAAISESVRAQRLIARYGPFDIQHSLDFTSSPFEAAAARMAGRRYVYSQRNLNVNGHPGLLRLKIGLSDAVIAIADHILDFVIETGGPKTNVYKVSNGIDIDEVDSKVLLLPHEPVDRILMVGQVVPLKRYEDAVRAFCVIADEFPNLRMEILGAFYDNDYASELQALVRSLGLEARLQFLGSRTHVLQLMRSSTALMICSSSEGLPWAVLEAMAAGTPVIASDIAANREIIEDNATGLIAGLGQVEAYADCLRRILLDHRLRQTLRVNARAVVESRFSARSMVAGLEKVYRFVARPDAAFRTRGRDLMSVGSGASSYRSE